jgi:2-dehydro-3-deoxygalactonokinase
VLVGEPTLCDRYSEACAVFGIERVRSLDETGPLGLWQIARAAGLVATRHPPAMEPARRG